MKAYTKYVVLGLIAIFVFGFLGPTLISAPSTEMVIAGFFLVLAFLSYLVWNVLKIFRNKSND